MNKEEWKKVKLGEVCEFCTGNVTPSKDISSDKEENLYPCYGGNGIRGYYTKYLKDGKYPIIGRVGALCGNIHLAEGKFYATEHAIIVSPNTELVFEDWLKFLLTSLDLRKFAKGVAQPVLSVGTLKGIELPLPPLSVQREIVSELDLLSTIITKKRAQLDELDRLAAATFHQTFGDPNENPKQWPTKKLGEVCENCDRLRIPITQSDRKKGIYPYYGASGIVDYVEDYIFDGDFLLVSEDGANLLLRSTPIAFSIKGKNWVNNHAHVLKFKEMATQIYIERLINCIDISMYVTGAAQPKFTQAKLNELKIPLPPLSLQQTFASKISSIEKQKELIKQSVAEVQTLLDATMDKYFG